MRSVRNIARSDKKGFINAVKQQLSRMKTHGISVLDYTHAVMCSSPAKTGIVEVWCLTFHNFSGRKFRAYVKVQIRYKDRLLSVRDYPVAGYDTQKAFLEFLLRECDK